MVIVLNFTTHKANTRKAAKKSTTARGSPRRRCLGNGASSSSPGILGAALMSALRNKYFFGPEDQPVFMHLSGHRLRSTTTQKLVSYLVSLLRNQKTWVIVKWVTSYTKLKLFLTYSFGSIPALGLFFIRTIIAHDGPSGYPSGMVGTRLTCKTITFAICSCLTFQT